MIYIFFFPKRKSRSGAQGSGQWMVKMSSPPTSPKAVDTKKLIHDQTHRRPEP
jgi:hypothetical protein